MAGRATRSSKAVAKAATAQHVDDAEVVDVVEQEQSQDDGDDGSDFSDEEPATKKRKGKPSPAAAKKAAKGKGKTAGRVSRLQLFTAAPLDVISEILMNLDVPTLLACTKTCQVLRNLLIAPSGEVIWKKARNAVSLPDLTAGDLTEWAYASLVYEKTCHVCQKPRAPTVDYVLRARGCKGCMKQKYGLLNEKNLRGYRHSATLSCVPSSPWMEYTFYWVPTVDLVSSLLYAASRESPEALEALKTQLQLVARRAKTDGMRLKNWEYMDLERRKDQKGDDAYKRRTQIEAKFKELGWTQADLDNTYAFRTHTLVNQPKLLTDRIWKTICPTLTAVLEAGKTARKNGTADVGLGPAEKDGRYGDPKNQGNYRFEDCFGDF